MAILTFLLPGLAQFVRGDPKKGMTMFFAAIVTGALTAGLGWFGCGLWSVVDSKSTPAPAPAAAASFAGGGTAALPASGSGKSGFMGWTFKFALLATGGMLVFYNVKSGNALQSLEMFGLKMQFSGSLAARAEASDGGDPATLSVGTLPSGASSLLPPDDPRGSSAGWAAADPKAGGQSSMSIAGAWVDGSGATYVFQETASGIHMREMSRMWLVSVETATCDGGISQGRFVADCRTKMGTSGVIDLAPDGTGALAGEYRDLTTGALVPMRLTR